MQSAAPSLPASRCTLPEAELLRGPLLLDARPGDLFFLGDDGECCYSLLVSPQMVSDGKRRWCVVIASNDPARPVGLLCPAGVETPVIPLHVADEMRVIADPLKWVGR